MAGEHKRHRFQRSPRERSGGAVVEFAVCIPLLLMLLLGSIEATSSIFLKDALNAAAYEGIREASRGKSTNASALECAQAVLTSRQVQNSTIAFSPSDTQTAARGTLITITVTAPVRGNSPFIGNVLSDRLVTSRAVMMKE